MWELGLLKDKNDYLTDDEQDKYFRKHLKGAAVRSAGSLVMILFGLVFCFTDGISVGACIGGFVSCLFVIVMNIPALHLVRRIQTRRMFDYVSLLINFSEIIAYTSIIYFLGGIRGAYLVPVYAAVISYVGIIAPKRYPYIVAGLCAGSFAVMIMMEQAGWLPRQIMFYHEPMLWVHVIWIVIMLTTSLFGVALITSYSSGILKKTSNDLVQKNIELEDSRKALSIYSESLEQSEKKYRRVFESIQNVYLEADINGNIIEISPSVEVVLGVSREKLVGRNICDSIYTNPGIVKHLRSEILENCEVKDRELQIYDVDGVRIFMSVSARLVMDELRPEGRVLIDANNITPRRKAEEALRESEERYRTLIEDLQDVVFIVTPEGYLEYTSPASIEFGGYDPEEVVGMHVSEFIADVSGVETAIEMLLRMLEEKTPLKFELLYKASDRDPFYVEISSTPIMRDDNVSGILCIMRDISHRKFAEEQVRLLTQELMQIQENERKRIACDLHDDVAQNLASLMIACETFFDSDDTVSSELRRKMVSFTGVLKRSLTFVRDLSYELRPPGLDQLGLVKTLSRYCEDFSEKYMIRVDFFPVGMEEITFDPDSEINIYRLIQEALNNVKKHADANYVVIKFVASVPDIFLRIEDDGKGFNVDDRYASSMAEKRMGLHSMTERVNFLGGWIKINSKINEGTMIIVGIPGNRFRKNLTEVA